MTTTKTTARDAAPMPILDDIGILRRFLRGRKWYGTEWYITVAGGGILLLIVIITFLAPVLAPFDPNEFAGAQFTPPGGGPQALLARAGQDPGQRGGRGRGCHLDISIDPPLPGWCPRGAIPGLESTPAVVSWLSAVLILPLVRMRGGLGSFL